jgi:hypothetical protein
MIPVIKKGRGLSGAFRYVMGQGKGRGNDWQPGQKSRVLWISGQGFGFDVETREDAELARRMMEFMAANQTSPTKRCEKDVLHMSLSWHADELPTREQMEQAARDALKAIGMEKACAVFAAHDDTRYAHLHIVASRINPETGRTFADRDDFKNISEWSLQYELQSGVIRCPLRQRIDPRDHEKVLEIITADRSTFTRRELERFINKSIVSRLEVRKLADGILARDEVIGLRESAEAPVSRYTTRQVLAAEQELARDARELHGRTSHGVTEHVRENIIDRYSHLDREQRLAFAHATGTEGLTVIAGEAGTGKSATVEAIREAYLDAGYRVRGLAWTNSVVQDMKKDGFVEAATIASEMKRLEVGLTRWNDRTVIIVDEAAMLATKNMAQLTARAREAGAKLILVGDDRQLSSIERGGMFSALRQELGSAELHQVRRVSDADQRHAFNRMHAGDFAQALEIFERQGAIQWTKTQDAAREALVAKYAGDTAKEPDKTRFVFAYTNADVDSLNRDIRAWRRERGELGEGHILQTRDGPQEFSTGDRIQFTGNAKRKSARDLGFTNGTVGTIRKIDGVRVTVELDGKKHGKPRLVEFTVGDNVEAGQFNTFRHGYAGTIYKGQGKTLDQSYLLHSNHWRRAASYVALTRHRENTSVFVARETAPDINQLAQQMARIEDRRAASQFHYEDRPGREYSGAEIGNTGRGREQQEAERQARRARLEQALQQPHRPEPEAARNGPKRDPGLER